MDKPGIIVGWHKKFGYLVYHGQQFVLLAAPTRSGKGVGVVIPNLLMYPDSMVVLDIKGENFKYTSKYRQAHGQEVYLFNPFSPNGDTHCWNMFDSIKKRSPHLWFGDLNAIGETLYPSKVDVKTKFFNDNARNLFIGLGLYLLWTPLLPCTGGEIFRQSSGYGKPIKTHIREIMESRKVDGPAGEALPNECLDALNRFLMAPDTTLGNVLSTFHAPLLIYSDPVVDAATSRSDFDLGDVRKKRMTIHFGITPDQLLGGAAQLLVNLFFTQLFILNLRELPQDNEDIKYQCLVNLDEMTAVGKIEPLDVANGYIAGYDLRLLTIVQSKAQIEDDRLYGRTGARTLITNHGLRILYPPKEQEDAEDYSKLLGDFTTVSRGRTRGAGRGASTTDNAAKRALMLPQELRGMPQDEEIIVMDGVPPIRCNKAYFYLDDLFVDRLREQSPYLASLGTKKLPNQDQLEHAAFVLQELRIPIQKIDVMTAWKAASKRRGVPVARPFRASELATMKKSDIANYEDIKKGLFRLLPGFAEVAAMLDQQTGSKQPVAA